MGIEALPLSYLAGWVGMLIAELPLLIKNYHQLTRNATSENNKAENDKA